MRRNEELARLLENEAFQAEIKDAKSAEEMQEIMARYGVEYTDDEVNELCAEIAARYQAELDGNNGEISEDFLENVSGGAKAGTKAKAVAKAAVRATTITVIASVAVRHPLATAFVAGYFLG